MCPCAGSCPHGQRSFRHGGSMLELTDDAPAAKTTKMLYDHLDFVQAPTGI